jgi:hypothetical protein
MVSAQQTILHDFAHPSFIALPVVASVTIPVDRRTLPSSYPDILKQEQVPFR